MRSSILALITLAVLSQSTYARPVGGEVGEDPISIPVETVTPLYQSDVDDVSALRQVDDDVIATSGGPEVSHGNMGNIAGDLLEVAPDLPVLSNLPLPIAAAAQAADVTLGTVGL